MKLRPIGDRVIVKPLEAKETTKGGIVLPDTAREKPQQAKVIAVGKGKIADDGKLIPMEVKKGDVILYGKYSGSETTIDEDEYVVLHESDILAIVE